jgi:RHS repeat-associated protein
VRQLTLCLVVLSGVLLLAIYSWSPRAVEAAPPPANLSALFVVGSTTLSAGDAAIKARIEQLGFTVSVKDAVSAVTADANDKGLVVISESVTSTNVNTKFRDVSVPVVVLEAALYDDMGMTGLTVGTDFDNQMNQTEVRITDSTHQMAANLTGTVSIATAPSSFAWGVPASTAIKVVSLANSSTRYALYGYETETTMMGMSAPARRVGAFLLHSTAAALNHNGWALFDAAIRWSANLSPFSLNSSVLFVVGSTTLSAGDVATKTRLESLGLTVSVKDSVSAVSADANGKGLVVISESCPSADVNSKFRDVVVPVAVLEPQIFDDMLMTGPTLNIDFGFLTDQLTVQIDNPLHQMAANLTGSVSLAGSPQGYAWGIPGATAIKVASLPSAPSRSLLFGYETGATMVGMNAPSRRAGVFLVHASATAVNSNGWALFDAAIRWCGNWGVNVARSSNGGVATASMSFSLGYLPSGTINGDLKGTNWGFGGGWMDGSHADFPDWVQVDFQGVKTISEIDVFTLQDPSTPSEPTESMTFTSYGATNYAVQYWKDNSWFVVPNASVSVNNKVWRRFVFSNIRTSKIRVSINDSADSTYSRITEVEAWQSQANQTPFTNPGGPYYGVTNSAVQFNGTGSVDQDGSITSYQWNFGDNSTGSGASPTHTYSSAGTYNVTLTVTDDAGASSTLSTTATIALGNQAPVANSGGPYLAPKNTAVQFNGNASYDQDGTISTYQWNFGDGTSGSGATPTHTYTTANTFTATLTVTDNSGTPSSSNVSVVVAQPDPNISYTQIFPGNITTFTGTTTIFIAASYDTNNAPVPGINYFWQTNYLGTDGLVTISQMGEFVAQTPGTYIVSAQGNGHRAQVTVTVNERPPGCIEDCPEFLQSEPDPTRWNPDNYPSSRDPENGRGRPIAQSPEGNGNFNFSIPILSLSGRGSDMDLALRYNSRVWNKSGNQISYTMDKDWPAPGWSLGFGKIINMPELGAFIIEPDGTRHGFKGDLTRTPTKYTFVAETTDGSFIKYRVVTTRNQFTGVFDSPMATVKYPNGITVSFQSATAVFADGNFDMYATQIIDHNGNMISIKYVWGDQDVSRRIETIKDTLGRVINFHYDSGGFLTAITAAGLKDANGQTTVRTLVRLHYKSQAHTFSPQLFSGLSMQLPWHPIRLLDAVYFPSNGQGFWFGDSDSYSPYGMLRKVILQRGMGFSTVSNDPVQKLKEQGTVTQGTMTAQQVYSYPQTPQSLTTGPTFETKTETWYGMTTPPAVTTYSQTNGSPRVLTITRPDNTQVIRYAYNNFSLPDSNPLKLLDGRVFKEEFKDAGGTLLRRTTIDWENGFRDSPRVTRTESSEFANGQTLTTANEYGYVDGTYNQITQVRSYGFGNALLSTSNTTYTIKNDRDISVFDQFYEYYPRQLYLPTSMEERSASNQRVSLTQFAYDETTLENVYGEPNTIHPVAFGPNGKIWGVVQHHEHYDPYVAAAFDAWLPYRVLVRGNVTSITRYINAAVPSGAIVDSFRYDITGNVIEKTSTGGIPQKLVFTKDTHNASPSTTIVGSLTDATAQVITSSVYDLNTGFVLRTKDANGRETVRNYFPSSWRAKETLSATGAHTTFEYNDSALTTTQTIRSSLNGPIASKQVEYFNGINKVYKREELGRLGSGGSSDLWSITEIEYDEFGRLKRETRPYGIESPLPQFTVRTYDALGRVTAIADPRDSASTFTYNDATRPAGASTDPGQTVMAYDAWERWRWSRFDASGRLVEVVEPNPAGGNGFKTLYTYDTLGNVTRIEQGAQVRRFAYDSLGRRTHQKLAEATATLNNAGAKATTEPEDQRWSTVFTYDDRSNLTTHTDARGVKTNLSYSNGGSLDPLNRLLSVSYDTSMVEPGSNVLPSATVTFQYRPKTATQLIDINQLAEVQVAGFSTEVYDYDGEGRLHEKRLSINGRPDPLTVTYDYDTVNRLNQITYPQQYPNNGVRKVVTHNYDIAGRVNSLRVNNVDYASQVDYNSDGQVMRMKVGTGPNQLTEGYGYDMVTGLVTFQNVRRGTTNTLMSLGYTYYRELCDNPSIPCGWEPWYEWTTGQVTSVSNHVTGRMQHFNYDQLGRLINSDQGMWVQPWPEEFEFIWQFQTDWKQDYAYDRYGNRTSVTATNNSGISPTPQDGLASVSYDQSSNRINSSGFTYDAAGNQLQDGTGRSFVYDAAGRLVKVKDSSGNTLETHVYDASRRRLITQQGNDSSTAKTFYLWSGDKVIAEYVEPSGATMPKWSKNFIYFGDGLLATQEPNGSGGELVRYYHPDRLGTRLVTNNADTTSFSQSNLPFGNALDASLPGSTRRFTSYDRDGTSLLDYAVNRYYDPRQGRFTQVDPMGMQAVDLLNPQSLNLYAYCGNDPMNARDPLGAWGFSFSFGGFGFGFGGGSERPGNGGGIIGGLINFGLGIFGSIFGGGGQRHIIGSPFFSLPPAPKPIPLPGPTHSTLTANFAQTPDLTTVVPLQRGLQRLSQYLAKVGPKSGIVQAVAVDVIQTALGEIFGNVFFHAGGLNPVEIQFAGEVAAFEKRSFQGAGRNSPGLDGFLHDGKVPTNNPRPIQLQQNNTGGMNRIRDDALDHEYKMKNLKEPAKNMALYIKYTKDDVSVWDVFAYIKEGGEEYGLGAITNRNTITEITIFVPDGVVRITRGSISVLSGKR